MIGYPLTIGLPSASYTPRPPSALLLRLLCHHRCNPLTHPSVPRAADKAAKLEAEKKAAADKAAKLEAEKKAAADEAAKPEAEKKAAADEAAKLEAEKKALQVLHPSGGTGHCPINTPRPILAPLEPAI